MSVFGIKIVPSLESWVTTINLSDIFKLKASSIYIANLSFSKSLMVRVSIFLPSKGLVFRPCNFFI